MRPSDAHAGTRAFQTNGPYHPECTVANNGQQRPPFEHARRARIWPGNFNYSAHSAHSHAALTTEHNASLLPGRPSAGAPRAVRRHLGRRRRRCVNVAVDLPKHRGAPRPQTSQCRFRALRAAYVIIMQLNYFATFELCPIFATAMGDA